MLSCGAFKCGDRWISKSYETNKGCPRFYLQTQFLYKSWKLRNAYWRIRAIGRIGNYWCIVQHDWVGGFGMG